MNVAIIDKKTLAIKNVYWSETGSVDATRPDIDDTVLQSVVPSDMDYFCIKANPDYSISVDQDKLIEKRNLQFQELRVQRNALLAQSDWTQMPDVNMSQDRKQAWADYRQALRDIPEDTVIPGAVVWPTVPGSVPGPPAAGSRVGNLLSQV